MEDPSVVGAFVVISMGMFKLIEKLVSKSANGGNGVDSYRLSQFEADIGDLKTNVGQNHSDFLSFREETRGRWARAESRVESCDND